MKEELDKTSADYKPEEVEYKDIEHNNSSTLIDAFVNNNTIEESKEQEEIIEEQIKQDIIDSTLEETVKQKQKITYPFSFKILCGWVICIGVFLLIAYFMLYPTVDKRGIFFFILMISSPITFPSVIINIFYDIYLLIKYRNEEDTSLIICSLVIDIIILIALIALIGTSSKSVDFGMRGLG